MQLLESVRNGLEITGIPFTGIIGSDFYFMPDSDDIGMYYFVPYIANYFHIPTTFAIDIFYYAILFIAFGSAIISYWFLYKSFTYRFIAGIGLILFYVFLKKSYSIPPYFIGSCTALFLIPLFFYIVKHKIELLRYFLLTAGILIGLSNYIRSHSGIGIFLFLVCFILLYKNINVIKKYTYIFLLTIGLVIPFIFFSYHIHNAESYLQKHNYVNADAKRSHPFWHSIYVGLGFMPNKYGITWLDGVASTKVKSINPNAAYLSYEYEKILKHEFFSLLKSDPYFILENVFRKSYAVFIMLLPYISIAPILALIYRNKNNSISFLIAIFFGSLPGIIVYPFFEYISVAGAFCILYLISSVHNAMDKGLLLDLRRIGLYVIRKFKYK